MPEIGGDGRKRRRGRSVEGGGGEGEEGGDADEKIICLFLSRISPGS